MAVKYVFVTGGVVSGLGKGITAASLGRLLKARGFQVTMQKFDPYINIDPGTNRRLACYYHGLLKYSTGNNVLENLYQAAVIKTNEDLENYLCEIADIEEYTQLSFDFV